jgi:hypothetical protein
MYLYTLVMIKRVSTIYILINDSMSWKEGTMELIYCQVKINYTKVYKIVYDHLYHIPKTKSTISLPIFLFSAGWTSVRLDKRGIDIMSLGINVQMSNSVHSTYFCANF